MFDKEPKLDQLCKASENKPVIICLSLDSVAFLLPLLARLRLGPKKQMAFSGLISQLPRRLLGAGPLKTQAVLFR